VLNTLAMGLGIWWVGATTDSHYLWFMATVVQALYTLAALINASTHPPTFVAGARINLGLAALFWLLQGTEGVIVAFTLVALTLLVSRFAGQIKADYDDTIRIRFEKDELLRRLQQETLAAQQARAAAEQANLAKSKFLAAASHDLRQPLHTLMLFASLLGRAGPAQQGEFLAHIRSAADSLNKLFSSLLDLSKLDSGAVTPNLQTVNAKRLLEAIASEAAPSCAGRGLSLETSLVEAHVRTDPFLFERIVRNLLDNAIKYTEQGSVALRAAAHGTRLTVTVEDTGVGIGGPELERIFEEFYQIGNPGRRSEHGTGLGLAIVQRLCRLLGHAISVRSAPGEGSAFSVELPLVAAPAPADAAGVDPRSADADGALEGRRVVVVDDDDRVRAAMAELIASWRGQTIAFASYEDARAALANWQGGPPAAVLADYRLGGEHNGFDLIRLLRRARPGLPAAIFTGDTDAFVAEQERMPDVPVFQKPVSAEEIFGWLATAIEEVRAGEEAGPGQAVD
jgi:signal transduction histidine kinase/CheY-like chemotaxis protein